MFSHRIRQQRTPRRQALNQPWSRETARHHHNLPRKMRVSTDGLARIQCRWLVNVVEGARSNVQVSLAPVLLAETSVQYVTIQVKEEIEHRGLFPKIHLCLNMRLMAGLVY
jgi:hypothetical protein